MDYDKSEHSMGIQRSRFIAMDHDLSNKNLFRMTPNFLKVPKVHKTELSFDEQDMDTHFKTEVPVIKDERLVAPNYYNSGYQPVGEDFKLSISYCKAQEIERKLKLLTSHKQKYLVKHAKLKINGQ